MKTYTLTVVFKVTSHDDPGARREARVYLEGINQEVEALDKCQSFKLQEVFPDKPPRKVNL